MATIRKILFQNYCSIIQVYSNLSTSTIMGLETLVKMKTANTLIVLYSLDSIAYNFAMKHRTAQHTCTVNTQSLKLTW